MQEFEISELLVLDKLEKELHTPIQREMMIKAGTSKVIFAGVAQIGSNLTGIEVKSMRKRDFYSISMWNSLFDRFESLFHSFNDMQKMSFSIIFAIVTDENAEEIKELIESQTERLSCPIDIRVYNFDKIRNENSILYN